MTSPFEVDPNPEAFQEELFFDVGRVQDYVDGRNERGAHQGATNRKAVQMLGGLAEKYRDMHVFLESPLFMQPSGDDIALAMGEITGRINGFILGGIPKVDESLNPTTEELGVLMVVTVASKNGEPSEGRKAWEQFLPADILTSIDANKHLLLVPIIEGLRARRLAAQASDFNTVEDFLRISETINKPFDHMDFVKRIESIMQGRATYHPVADGARKEALDTEIEAMNSECPYFGKEIELTSEYWRTPHPVKPGGFLIMKGTARGVLRKFVYGPYQPEGKMRGAAQAVIYTPEIAEKVRSGELTPQQADKTFGTIFAPLDIEHTLEVKS